MFPAPATSAQPRRRSRRRSSPLPPSFMFPAPATSAQPRRRSRRRSLSLSLSLSLAACSPWVEKKNRGKRGEGGSGDPGGRCDGATMTGRIEEEGEKQRREGKKRKKEKEGEEEGDRGDNAGESVVCAGCKRRERVHLVRHLTEGRRGVVHGGAEDGGETEREKKSEAVAFCKQRRKMGALHLLVVRWW
ncbi:hypothetical protein AAC387_Pa01g3518 [Persea americana]